ncbi:MAG: alanine racemase [Clostridiales bacterium]|nr:alanine racemase [Clostridiales bacterium]
MSLLRTWVQIDLDALSNNLNEISKLCKKSKILTIVKSNAYGHGFLESVKVFIKGGAYGLGVAFIDEAIQIRKAKINVPILVLGYTVFEAIKYAFDYNIILTVFTNEFAENLSKEGCKRNKKIKIHIKVDTGMNRLGFIYNDDYSQKQETIKNIVEISKLSYVEIEGLFTHFSSSEQDKEFTKIQFKLFMNLVNELEKLGISIPIKHCANSAGIINFPNMHLDMVRPGIILYGLYPNNFFKNNNLNLIPAMQFKTRVAHLKEIEKDQYVSYGNTYKTDKKTKIATISVGYADGYPRFLSNKTKVIVKNKLSQNIGKICMDQCMIDVTHVNNIKIGNEVILFGTQGNLSISIDELAKINNSINYEMLCMISKRVPRIYTKNGKVIKIMNDLLNT